MEFFCPTRASSCHHISMGIPDLSVARISASAAGKFFKCLDRIGILPLMARTGRELAIVGLAKDPAHGLRAERDAEFLEHPLHQIDEPPADDTVDGGHRSSLHSRQQDAMNRPGFAGGHFV